MLLDPTAGTAAAVAHLVALGIIRSLDERGLRVPTDCSVVGSDDIPLAGRFVVRASTAEPAAAPRPRSAP